MSSRLRRTRSGAPSQSGVAVGPPVDRNELIESERRLGTPNNPGNLVPGQDFGYSYDPTLDPPRASMQPERASRTSLAASRQGQVGNRESYLGDALEGAMEYTTNSRNQYDATTTPNETFTYDADGNLTQDRRYGYWYDGENRLIRAEPISQFYALDDRQVRFTYDYLGRRVRKLAYTRSGSGWSTTPSLDRRFIYDPGLAADAMRQCQRQAASPRPRVKGNLLLELDGLNSNAVVTKFTWGLDLSGQNGNVASAPPGGRTDGGPSGLHGAGGIGGLLAMTNTMGTSSTNDDRHFAYFYDATLDPPRAAMRRERASRTSLAASRQGQAGNVGQLVDSDPSSQTFGSTQARYEYYPFGGILVPSETSAAAANPFKFSTKYRDKETSLYYYGYRYLIPRLGRWLTRDPIGELGGLNLYAAMGNDPANRFDPDGRACITGFGCRGPQPPTSQPPSGTTTPPTPPPPLSPKPGCETREECQKRVDELWENDPLIQELRALCPKVAPPHCTDHLVGGTRGGAASSCDEDGSAFILVGSGGYTGKQSLREALIHELWHGCQCELGKLPNICSPHGADREVEAHVMSGACARSGSFRQRWGPSYRDCLKAACIESLSIAGCRERNAAKFCEEAVAKLEGVWDNRDSHLLCRE